MSDTDLMAALIQQHAKGSYLNFSSKLQYCDATQVSSRNAAEALYKAGFRMGVDDTDRKQDAALRVVEDRLTRLEGWAGLPSLT